MPTIFITGTDTDVGKTVVSAGLAAALEKIDKTVCVYKPLQTGSTEDADMAHVRQLTERLAKNIQTGCSFIAPVPATPWISDLLANGHETIDPARFIETASKLSGEFDWLIIEGAGGVRVPITSGYENIDLIQDFACPAIVVTRPDLGTINHTLLTVEALLSQRIPVMGAVVSRMPQTSDPQSEAIQTLPEVFKQYLPVPVLAWLPDFQFSEGKTSFFSEDQIRYFQPIVEALHVSV